MDENEIKDIAQKFKRLSLVPLITTREVAEVAQISPDNLRMWINRGHLELRLSESPAPGKARFFTSLELLEVMAFSELARLGFSPDRFSGSLAEVVMSTANIKISELAGSLGTLEQQGRNFERYVVVFFDSNLTQINWEQCNSPHHPYPEFELTSWVVIDCLALAHRALIALEHLSSKAESGKNPLRED